MYLGKTYTVVKNTRPDKVYFTIENWDGSKLNSLYGMAYTSQEEAIDAAKKLQEEENYNQLLKREIVWKAEVAV